MSRFAIYTVYLLRSGLNNEDERQSSPLTETLHCTSTRRASSRYAGRDRDEETPKTENKREMLMRRVCARRSLNPSGGGTKID